MAIENALIAKIGGGLVVASGAGSAGIYYREQIANGISDFFTSKEQTDVFLVVKKTGGSDSTVTSDALYEGKENETRKFQCKSSNNEKTDDKCDIYELTPKNTEHKLIGLKEFKEIGNDKKATKEKITSDTFFKLKVKKNVFNVGDTDIKLVSTDPTKKDAKYGTFDVLYKIEGDAVTGKTNLIIGKVLETKTITPTGTTCNLEGEDNKQACVIYQFTSQPASGKDYRDLSFETTSPTTSVTSGNFTKDSLYLIDLKEKKLDISKLTDKSVIVYENTTELIKFDFVAPLVSDVGDFAAATTKTFFLS